MKMRLYIADRLQNAIMKAADLKGDHKEFVTEFSATFQSEPTNEYFQSLLDKGRSFDERIVAVEFAGEWFLAEGVKCLSDGRKERWFKDKNIYEKETT